MSIYDQTSASDHFWELTMTMPEPELDWQWTKNFILHKKLVSKHWLTSISLLLDTKVHEAEATLNWKLEKCFKNISWHLQNLRRWVDTNDSSWQWVNWGGQWCWSRRSSQTWWDPRTWWIPWSQSTRNYPSLWDQKPPRTESAKSPINWNEIQLTLYLMKWIIQKYKHKNLNGSFS